MAEITLLDKAKLALRIVTDAYDGEIQRLIDAAEDDLGFADVDSLSGDYPSAIEHAIITFVRLSFGEPTDYERLKKSYDEQKAQLQIYTINHSSEVIE